MNNKELKHFRAVIYRNESDTLWLVRCLENNIAAQGKSFDELLHRFKLTFDAQAALDKERGLTPFSDSSPAPQKYFDLFEKTENKSISDFETEGLDTKFAVCA
ncbi:hypothetical protein [Leptospira alexanderi]|uniref:Uncharacterized protein n=1 Tax=Leptospira alexanderi serovar Manhao 3 str. L 60 TaxID=1049759 RepID=V6HWP0_9LEPT|nr:hypothetical protein [Leptospira alexanderi]EQA61896.1 hypothetical protein LEP1GSC062_3247 [Leptospira alexanderi serovar Manhao 3 str. L 60]